MLPALRERAAGRRTRSSCRTPKSSTAGIHVANVLEQLGIADEVAARLRIFPNGATAMRELAASDARRPIGCTQSTEIISTKGVTLSGSLPPGCELATMYTAGITAQPPRRSKAQDLIEPVDRRAGQQRDQRERAGFIELAPDLARDRLTRQTSSYRHGASLRARKHKLTAQSCGRDFRFVKANSYTNISIEKATMPARASKKTEILRFADGRRHARSGRPRAATAASKIYSDLRIELVSLQRRPRRSDLGEPKSRSPTGEPHARSRGDLSNYRTKACWRSIPSPASSSRAFRSQRLPEAIIIRKALRKPPHGWPRSARRRARFWPLRSVLERQREASARRRQRRASIRPMKRFMLQSPMSPGYPGIWKYRPAGEGPRRSLSAADAAPARADRQR